MEEDYIIEFIAQGRFMRVAAVDPITGTEAVIVGDVNAPREALEREAVKKLEYIMKKPIQGEG